MNTVGFDQPLYILPFDHRASFQAKMFGWKGTLSPDQTAEIAATKKITYDGFKAAIQAGVARQKAGIQVDEQFGADRLPGREKWPGVLTPSTVKTLCIFSETARATTRAA